MSSTTPDISSALFQSTRNSFASQILSDDDNDSINETLDATDGNTNKTPVIDTDDKEYDDANPEKCEKNHLSFFKSILKSNLSSRKVVFQYSEKVFEELHPAPERIASETSVDYDRTKELKEFDDTKAGVKGLVDAGIVSIPKMFIRPAEELAVEELNSCQTNIKVPIIDLSNIQDDSWRKEIVDKVRIASAEWGFFQVINHGIPLSVLDEMIDGVRMFNEKDLELKKELHSREATKKVRFNSNFDLYKSLTADWRDTMTLSFLDSDSDPEEMPAVCR
ncbi:1-aminocyclopropane-1-carboxylate oxidase homolog [Durio zibethinus]|uniref:1-aminocyclopropane-1-carboxylate oxidase homolog n=1 Tax=Durio zibethinus TaxID=66656 RepID=A0A6P5Z8I5_DURZI|nr:1-aminocyclopropane-1-carboxylate oxidase homolog [Durio zibethinus]